MHPNEIKEAFERGENITQLLRRETGGNGNTEEIIEIAYDMQAGSYISQLNDPVFEALKRKYAEAIAAQLQTLGIGGSVLEVGVGECTTLSYVMTATGSTFSSFHGFDISWSRVAKGRDWLASHGLGASLVVASIFNAPYLDDSFDIVYTSHSIEPNGGNEVPLLQELYRIARRYLVLVEPGFEFADEQAQKRMERLGYVQNVKQTAESLGMHVVKHQPFDVMINASNPSAITIIEKNTTTNDETVPKFACPKFGDPMVDSGDSFYATGSMMAYPKILGLPCLRIVDGVIASKYVDHSCKAEG